MKSEEFLGITVDDVQAYLVEIEASKNQLKDIDCGDIVIKDSGHLGLDIYHRDGTHLMCLNKIGERLLLDWLVEKNKNNPEWVESNFNRLKEGIKTWRRNDSDK